MADPLRIPADDGTAYERLLAASGDDPFVRYAVPRTLAGPAYALDGAVTLLRRTHTGRLALAAFGPTTPLLRLVRAVLADEEVRQLRLARVSVPQDSAAVVLRAVADHAAVGGGDDWEWMWSQVVPPADVGAGHGLQRFDDRADAAELAAFLDRVSPSSHATPGSGAAQLWLGLRDAMAGVRSGRILACGAMDREAGGYATLSGIAVEPSLRGTGLGRAITAELTRHAVALDGVCTLGMFSYNTVARGLYRSLGYRIGHRWATHSLSPTEAKAGRRRRPPGAAGR